MNKPCCPGWNKNIAKIDRGLEHAALNGIGTKLDQFKFCPWCGSTKHYDNVEIPPQKLLGSQENNRMIREQEEKIKAEETLLGRPMTEKEKFEFSVLSIKPK